MQNYKPRPHRFPFFVTPTFIRFFVEEAVATAVVTDEKTVRFPLLRPSHLMLTSQFDMHKVISKHWGENPGMPTAL